MLSSNYPLTCPPAPPDAQTDSSSTHYFQGQQRDGEGLWACVRPRNEGHFRKRFTGSTRIPLVFPGEEGEGKQGCQLCGRKAQGEFVG